MIRKYQPSDVDDVLAAWEAASALAHPFVSAKFLDQERHNIPNLYLPNAETWVWDSDEKVVGFIALLGNEIGGLFVDPVFHRKGIGGALLEHARELKGELDVDVFEANSIGRAFYKKHGFVQMHRVEEQVDGFDLLRLRLARSADLEL